MSTPTEIEYSEKYADDRYEYRHVILPREVAKRLPVPHRLLSETEWRMLGVMQSRGWQHYEVHKPEPHVLLFRRPLGTDPHTGRAPDGNTGKENLSSASNLQPQQQQTQPQQQQQRQPTRQQQQGQNAQGNQQKQPQKP